MDRVDDLRAVDALEVDRCDPEVRVPLALNDHERNALLSHFDRMRVPELVRRESAAYASRLGPVTTLTPSTCAVCRPSGGDEQVFGALSLFVQTCFPDGADIVRASRCCRIVGEQHRRRECRLATMQKRRLADAGRLGRSDSRGRKRAGPVLLGIDRGSVHTHRGIRGVAFGGPPPAGTSMWHYPEVGRGVLHSYPRGLGASREPGDLRGGGTRSPAHDDCKRRLAPAHCCLAGERERSRS